MFQRLLSPSKSNSFFLLGPRGAGKTTLLHRLFKDSDVVFIDLLNPNEEDLFIRNPMELEFRAKQITSDSKCIIIDEIQKVPKLLDVVHGLIEKSNIRFILTGSSSRKIKRGAANMLAGRAFIYTLHPLTSVELGDAFDLDKALAWGTLPKLFKLNEESDKAEFLRSYALTYIKEEILTEQIIRKLDPFRRFLEIAAQMNGKPINYSKVAEDTGVDIKTVQSYFNILEDTNLGFMLKAYHSSKRKSLRFAPKFYFFDTGVKRAIERTLTVQLLPNSYAYGNAFEHFLILEIRRLASYKMPDWDFSFLRTKDGAEIDLIIDRPGAGNVLIEIKSSNLVSERDISTLNRFRDEFANSEAICLSQDPNPKRILNVQCFPWKQGLDFLGLL